MEILERAGRGPRGAHYSLFKLLQYGWRTVRVDDYTPSALQHMCSITARPNYTYTVRLHNERGPEGVTVLVNN